MQHASFEQRTTSPSGSSFAGSISIFNDDLYYTNTSGIPVQITDGGSLVTTPGSVQNFETQNVASSLIISPSDTFVHLAVDTTAARTITLPLASSVTAGRIYIIKDASGQANTNNITIATAGSDTVDGQSSQNLNSDYGSHMLITDGVSSWLIS